MAKSFTSKDVREALKDSSYQLVGKFKGVKEYNSFKSKVCGHTFDILWRNLQRKISKGEECCKECSKKNRIENMKLGFDSIKEEILKLTQREYKLISDEKSYTNNKSLLKVLHKNCGSTFDITFSNFQQGRRCPVCANKSKESKTAQILKRVLKHLGFDYEEEKKFDKCKNPFTEYNLRFDIYIESINTVIEIDGEQHYIPVHRFGGQRELMKTKYRDSIKNKFCFENDIKLIRISLYDFENHKKKSYEEMKLEVFYLINVLVKEKESYNKKNLSNIDK